jgi:hypothetical protein
MSGVSKIKYELSVGIQYFFIAFIASSIAYSVFESTHRLNSGMDVGDSSGSDINIKQMIVSMWYGYYRWWFFAFIGLSALRILLIFVFNTAGYKRLRRKAEY